jgi:phosphatidylinositol alpha-1,6-mannosyltransferase
MRGKGRSGILMVNIGFLPQIGGSYLSLYQFTRAFPPGSVTLLTGHAEGEREFDRRAWFPVRRCLSLTLSDRNGAIPRLGYAPLYRGRVARALSTINPLYYPVMALQLARVVREVVRGRYAMVWSGQAVPTGWMGWGVKRLTGLPYCVFVYGEDVTYFRGRPMTPGKFLLLRALRDADLIVANSESTRRETLRLCRESGVPLRLDRFPVITPGVDTGLFRPAERPRERGGVRDRTLISVTRLTPQKGVDRVVRVLPAILEEFPGTRYLIRGDGPHRPFIERLVRRMGLERLVRFLDPVPYEELPGLYARGDLFLLPGRRDAETGEAEGFGTVFLEAAACGLPVIGGRVGGAVEAVEDGVTGYLVDPEDDEALRRRIVRLLRDDRLAREMGRRGRARVVESFGWERRSRALWEEMKAILERNQGHVNRGDERYESAGNGCGGDAGVRSLSGARTS